LGQDIQATDATTTTGRADVLMPSQRKSLPSSFTTRARNVRNKYVEGVLNGSIAEPAPGTPEAKSLAALASKARWGKAPKGMKRLSVSSGTVGATKAERRDGNYV